MANKPKSEKPTDEGIARIDQAIKFATERKEEEIAKLKEKLSLSPWIFEMAGKIKGMMFTEAQARCFKVLFLKKVKESKDYREVYGMTWEQFCEHVHISWRTADKWLEELEPLTVAFSANFADFSGHDLNKIKYLAKAKSANIADFTDTSIIYQGEEIPLSAEHADQIRAVFEDIKDELKKLHDERDLDRHTHERRMADEKKHSQKLEHVVSKFEKEAAKQGLTLEEDAFIKKCENLRIGFDGYMLSLDPDRMEELIRKNNPTTRMVSAYVSVLKYMKMQICSAHDTAIDTYADPSMFPDEGWQPPEEVRAPVYSKPRHNKAEA